MSVLRADEGTRISGIQDLEDKDIVLGGLLRVLKHNGRGKCGSFRQEFGIFGCHFVCYRSSQQ